MNHLTVLTQTQDPSGSRMFDHFLSGGGRTAPVVGRFVRLDRQEGSGWQLAKVLAVSKDSITLLVFPGEHDRDARGRSIPGVEQVITREEWRARARSLGMMEGGAEWGFGGMMSSAIGLGMGALVIGGGVYLWRHLRFATGSAAVDPYKRRDDLRRMAAETSGATPNERAMAARQLAKIQATLPKDDPLPRFDARARGEEARRARRPASDPVSLDPLEAAVVFGRRASYDGETKAEWKRRAMAVLHQVAKDLHLAPHTYTISFDPGGIAVAGDAILHHDRVYVNLSPLGWSDGYARRCAGQKDYGGKWGPGWENHDIPRSYEGLVRLVRDLLEPVPS